jgi:enamine deaminase RidA (YjgF/YER057c/UK114 family)
LKARGVVSIAFWSLIVSFSSGIIGRYFYIQLVSKKVDLEAKAAKALQTLDLALQNRKITVDERLKSEVLDQAIAFVGGQSKRAPINAFNALFKSMLGDMRLMVSDPPAPGPWPEGSRSLLRRYAICHRQADFLVPFQRLMGYWHTFHFPFAVFMYIAAVIHVISSLIFQKS